MNSASPCPYPRQRVVIIGAAGRLGSALVKQFERCNEVTALDREEVDLGSPRSVSEVLEPMDFDLLILPAALTAVDYCEDHASEAFAINAEGPGQVARICHAKGARLAHISTDFVFDGLKPGPYREEDPPKPISVYGASKLQGEENVLAVSDDHLVVRLSWMFGSGHPAFPEWIIQKACSEEHLSLPEDKVSCPSYTVDVAALLEALLEAGSRQEAKGIVHLSNSGPCTWRQWGQFCIDQARECGAPVLAGQIEPTRLESIAAFVAKRPENSALDTTRFTRLTGIEPRSWQEAVADYLRSADFAGPRG